MDDRTEPQRQRPDYKKLFNPLPKARPNNRLRRQGKIGIITDVIQTNRIVTFFAGYRGIQSVETQDDIDEKVGIILQYLMPNIMQIVDPEYTENLLPVFGNNNL